MPLIEEMEATGRWLFRWRGYLPLAALVLLAVGLQHFAYPFGSHRWDQAWELACLVISVLGVGVRVATVAVAPRRTSGRNRKGQVADTLNTTGMYSLVRNPLYLGNFLVGLGVSLFLRAWWMPVIYSLVFVLYYERIIFAEEMFLRQKFGDAYASWAASTPMLLPRLRPWQPPALRFNWRKVLRQEHQTAFGLVVVLYVLEVAGDWRVGKPLFDDTMWNAIAASAVVMFVAVRTLYKLTDVLQDQSSEPAGR